MLKLNPAHYQQLKQLKISTQTLEHVLFIFVSIELALRSTNLQLNKQQFPCSTLF